MHWNTCANSGCQHRSHGECHEISHGIPWLMLWHAMSYPMACRGIWHDMCDGPQVAYALWHRGLTVNPISEAIDLPSLLKYMKGSGLLSRRGALGQSICPWILVVPFTWAQQGPLPQALVGPFPTERREAWSDGSDERRQIRQTKSCT